MSRARRPVPAQYISTLSLARHPSSNERSPMAPVQYQVAKSHYVPVGCVTFTLQATDSLLLDSVLQLSELKKWSWICPVGCETEEDHLTPKLRTQVLERLYLYRSLVEKQWIRVSVRQSVDKPEQAVLRIYFLPDDVARARIDRTNSSLQAQRMVLLAELDYSPIAWGGTVSSGKLTQPPYFDEPLRSAVEEGQSLLELYNSLPAPNPEPAHLLDDNDLAGLRTKLYPYQQRSVATMIQREYQPCQFVDPRLEKVVDQDGKSWFYDAVTGSILAHPRYYDNVRGGILAEEMGSGKTIMCLALILATKHQPSTAPDIYLNREVIVRPKVGSLADMAAVVATRSGSPWKLLFNAGSLPTKAISRNPGYYYLPSMERGPRRSSQTVSTPKKTFLCHATLVIVPGNLVRQWVQEIDKHVNGDALKYIVVDRNPEPPTRKEIMEQDLILFSKASISKLYPVSTLTEMHFKRCIVDEGHGLGAYKTELQRVLDSLQITARWVVSGTPTKGLYGVDQTSSQTSDLASTSLTQEAEDLRRLGLMAQLYLKARPWANKSAELGDTPAQWSRYVMQPGHSASSGGSQHCLRATMASLIVRHRSDEHSKHLPKVNASVIFLVGSYQDVLCINLFSMFIIFNAVQSERKDADYFFHSRQRRALTQLVSNLKQATFFGGWFYSAQDITKALETVETFLEEGKVAVSDTDMLILRDAMMFGRSAVPNRLKMLSTEFQTVPVYVRDFPGEEDRREWSLDLRPDDPVCTNGRLIGDMQKFLRPVVNAPYNLKRKFQTGDFRAHGSQQRHATATANDVTITETQLASNSRPSHRHRKRDQPSSLTKAVKRSQKMTQPGKKQESSAEGGVADALAKARLVSTASAKLTYLIDQIVKYQDDEQIIIFYDEDNEAYVLSETLEILQIQHLIYSKRISIELRARYIDTFNHSSNFRVMLMDIQDAAFGLDVQRASRVYFLHPVLDANVEAQAIGRARRIGQTKDVTVETLVLKSSFEAFVVQRRAQMTAGEQRQCKDLLDDKPIQEFIENAKIIPLPDVEDDGISQTAMLKEPQYLFGRTFARAFMIGVDNPDEDLVVLPSPTRNQPAAGSAAQEKTSLPIDEKDVDNNEILFEPPSKRRRAVQPGQSKKRRVVFSDADGSS